ncbi:unnamed protein product [Microthlaspi erraticum]|uniref:Neprosin activation peptide domain-containing protein n=1 Tax=Microthlaspi erraticum TaxID=1685480 RepID=A0A6D2LGA1_9BRAS|nr:unnamed protein product [Microthlaspi erraticum]
MNGPKAMEGSAEEEKFSDLREEEIQRQLKQLIKTPVKTFHLPNGDIIDCIRLTDQPAFDNPLLKGHKIQMRPSSFPFGAPNEAQSSQQSYSRDGVEHSLGQIDCPKCPKFTVPIIRTTREGIIRRANGIKKAFPPTID